MNAYGISHTPPETLTDLEARGILNCLQDSPFGIRARAMIQMMYRCGMRKGEVLNLHPSRIRIDGLEPMVQIRKSKFGKGRDVAIDRRIIADLKAWDELRPHGDHFFCTLVQKPANGISKGNPTGSQLSHGMINTIIQDAAKRAGIERKVWPHMFRHTCATNWLREDIPLEHIRVLLGHASIAVTQRYLHASPQELAASIYGLSDNKQPVSPLTPLKQLLGDKEVECAWCAEPVKAKARKCKHCRSDLTPRNPAKKPPKLPPDSAIEVVTTPIPDYFRC